MPPWPAATPAEGRYYVPALDGLRILAFLGVWAFHAEGGFPTVGAHRSLAALVGAGALGVPLFFVLSAFLITRLLLAERARTGTVDLRAYYARRALRIWPLYSLATAVGLVVAHRLGEPVLRPALALATFTANWFHGHGGSIPTPLGPLWSVSVEEQFYLAWPLLLSRVSRRGLGRVCGAMVAVAFVARLWLASHNPAWVTTWIATPSHLDSLALGTLLALASDRLPRLTPARGHALMALCVAGMVGVNLWHPFYGSDLAGAAVAYSAVPFLCAAVVALAIATPRAFLARPRVAAAGRLSYGLYVWHLMPLVVLRPQSPEAALACLALAALVAVATHYGVERPFLRLKRRFERVPTRPEREENDPRLKLGHMPPLSA